MIISSEEKIIPANLHYQNPNTSIPGLTDGRLDVVAENTPWEGGLVAINNFGFGGTNVHAVLDTSAADSMVSVYIDNWQFKWFCTLHSRLHVKP